MRRFIPGALRIAAGTVWLLALNAGAAMAGQDGATLTVTVRDAYGVVPGAAVTVAASSDQSSRAIADESGVARFTGLAAGRYDVRASFTGFADVESRGVELGAGETRALDLQLTLVQFSSQVTVTTASRREQLLLDVAEPTMLIDHGQIADTGARTAKDLLLEQSGAGVQVQAGGGQGHVSINGIPNSGVLVLVDGRRYLGKDANGNLNLEDLPLAGVERIEVVKGAGSALYGSDALGGVINFVTRRSKDPGVWTTFNLSGGSYGDVRTDGTAGWRGKRGGLSGGAGYRTYDGFDLSEANPQTVGQPKSHWKSGNLAADYRFGEAVVARMFGDYSKRDITNYFFSGATQLPASVYDSQRGLTRYTVSPTVDVQVSPAVSFAGSYTAGRYLRDETRIFVVGGRVVPQAPWRERNDEVKLSGRYDWTAAGRQHPLQAGYEYRREELRRGTLSVSNPHRDIKVVWFQQEVGLTDRLRVAAGLRYDNYSDFGSEWSPKLNAVYSVAERHRVRASYGHGFRPPYFNELYLYTPPSFVGNPDLRPEIANTFSGGYAFASPRVQVSADYYHAAIEDGIIFDLRELPYTYGNLRKYSSKGVNLTASVTLPGGFTPSVSYTSNKREDPDGVDIGGFPHQTGFVKLLWTNTRLGLRANVRGQLLGKVPPATDGTYQPGYKVWYFHVSKQLVTRGAHGISVFAQSDNLSDVRDIFLRQASGQPVVGEYQVWIAPRTYQVGVAIDLDWTR